MAQSHRIFKASLFLFNEEDNDAVGEDDVEAICLVGRSYFEGCVVFSTFLHCATARPHCKSVKLNLAGCAHHSLRF